MENLQLLLYHSEKLIRQQEDLGEIIFKEKFEDGEEPRDIEQYRESFMQHCEQIVDVHPPLRSFVFTVLSYLTFIKAAGFGQACFMALRDFIISSEVLSKMVI